jgi:pseudouridine-5'-phosphate glycosidase
VVRLLNSSRGGVLCLAGEVDAAAVEEFRRWYGPEPAAVAVIDARSVTGLSPAARELVHDHLDAAERARRPVALRAISREGRAPSPAPPRR